MKTVVVLLAGLIMGLLVDCKKNDGSSKPTAGVDGFIIGSNASPQAPSSTPFVVHGETAISFTAIFADNTGLKGYSAVLSGQNLSGSGTPWAYNRTDTVSGITRKLPFQLVVPTGSTQGLYRLTVTCTNLAAQTSDPFTQDFTVQP